MKKLLIALSIGLLLNIGFAHSQRVIGFYGDWHFWGSPNHIDNELQYEYVTDIVFSFILPNSDGSYRTSSGDVNFFDQLTRLRDNLHARGKKIHISAGGWSASNDWAGNRLNPDPVQEMANNEAARDTFINKMLKIIEDYNLDGFNLDWEYPDDVDNYAVNKLLLGLKLGLLDLETKMNKKLELSIAVGGTNYNTQGYNNTSISYVDFVYIMAFDNQGDHHSTVSFAENCMDFWLNSKNLPASKMILGVPFYSRGSGRNTGPYKNFSASDPAAYFNDEDGVLNNYAYNSKPILKTKISEMESRGGAGVFIWNIWEDRTDDYSLLRVLYYNIVGTQEISNQLKKINVFPNPVQNTLNINTTDIQLGTGQIQVEITDITGKSLYNQNLNLGTNTIDISTITSKGVYFVNVKKDGGQATFKLLKQK